MDYEQQLQKALDDMGSLTLKVASVAGKVMAAARGVSERGLVDAVTLKAMRVVLEMQQYMANMDVRGSIEFYSDGSGHLHVRDAVDDSFCDFTASWRSTRVLSEIDTAGFPGLEWYQEKWECAKPTPRKGDFRYRKSWR